MKDAYRFLKDLMTEPLVKRDADVVEHMQIHNMVNKEEKKVEKQVEKQEK